MPDAIGFDLTSPEPLVQYAVALRAHIVLPPGHEAEARALVAEAVQKGRERNPDSKIYLDIGPENLVETHRENDAARRLKRPASKTGRQRNTTRPAP